MDKILLFIPMYNCEKQIVRVIEQLKGEIRYFISEVIIVNNLSTDNSEKNVIEKLEKENFIMPIKLLRNSENYGLGGSHKVAFNYAIENGFDYIIVLHGDDQGNIGDFLELLNSKKYIEYEAILGARFMKDSVISGYSKIRILGNYIFNFLFSICSKKIIYDLGSGLNMYRVNSLNSKSYLKYPDTLYFNDFMILYYAYYDRNIIFLPISWREEDQISNNKIIKFSIELIKMLFKYKVNPKKYIEIDNHSINKSYNFQNIFEKKV